MATTFDQTPSKDNYGQRGPVVYVPPTTDSALVFAYDRSKKKFDRKFYSPVLTEGRSNTEQIESFLSKVERKINKKMDKINKLNKFFAIASIFGFVVLILFGFCIFNDEDSYGDDDDFSGYAYDDVDGFFVALMVYLFTILFYSLLLQFITRRKQKKARKSVERIIEKHNGEFTAQGLRWNMPLAFPHWIELWKDYRVQNSYPQALAAPQGAYNFTNNQIPATYQYPMPQQAIPRNPLNVQPRQIYPSLMAQPLLSHQNEGSANYMPPSAENYNN
jgi:hypothetical protein